MKVFNEIVSGKMESDTYVPINLFFAQNESPSQKLLCYSWYSIDNGLFLEFLVNRESKKIVRIVLTSPKAFLKVDKIKSYDGTICNPVFDVNCFVDSEAFREEIACDILVDDTAILVQKRTNFLVKDVFELDCLKLIMDGSNHLCAVQFNVETDVILNIMNGT